MVWRLAHHHRRRVIWVGRGLAVVRVRGRSGMAERAAMG